MNNLFLLLFLVSGIGSGYFIVKKEKKLRNYSIIAAVASFLLFGVTIPSEEKVQSSVTSSTERQIKESEITESTKKEIQLVMNESFECDDSGKVTIIGKSDPQALVSIKSTSNEITSDSKGDFQLIHQLETEEQTELTILAEKDNEIISKQITLKPSEKYLAKKTEEKKKKADEERIAKEKQEQQKAEEQKQAEIAQKVQHADEAMTQAEANQTRDLWNHAKEAIAAIPGGNPDLSNRLVAVDNAIQSKEQEAQQAAAAAAETPVSEQVLVTPTGSKYHNRKCGNGTYTPTTLDDALARGLTPCSKCY